MREVKRVAILLRLTLLISALVAGCSRNYTAPPPDSPVLNSLEADGHTLAPNDPVPAVSGSSGGAPVPTRLTVRGQNLGGTQKVFIGGALAANLSVGDTAVSFDAPSPDAVSVAQTETITVADVTGERTAGTVRFYLKPELDSIPPPVNAPSQVVLTGQNFSPVAGEDVISVEGVEPDGGAQPTVLVASSTRLVVELPADLPEGRHILTLNIVPVGNPLSRTLSAARNPLIWKVISAFWNDPPQAFASTLVEFRPPQPDGGNLYVDLDNELQLQLATHSLDLPVAPTLANSAPNTGGSVATGSGTGNSDGATSSGGSSGTTAGAGDTTTGGTGLVLDAGNLGANYPPDDGGDSVPDQSPYDDTTGGGGAGLVDAHAGLSISRDGINTGEPPLIDTDSALDDLSWVVPAGVPVGPHQIALSTPAGTSPYAPLVILPGHLAAPSLSCWPLAGTAPIFIAARSMHSQDTQGDVLLAADDGAGGLVVQVVHPGGALEQLPLPSARLGGMVGMRPSLVSAGRDLVYVSDKAASGLAALTFAFEPDAGFSLGAGNLDFSLGGPVLAVLEPNSHEVYTWVLVNSDPPALMNWTGLSTTLDEVGGALPDGCTVVSGAMSPLAATLAASCDGGSAWLGTAPLPPLAGVPSVPLQWTFIGAGDVAPRLLQALPQGVVVGQLSSNEVVYATPSTDPNAPGITVSPVDSTSATALALSPDSLQALVGGANNLDIALLGSDGSWQSQGSFAIPGTVSGLSYDAAGSQAVALWNSADGGSGFCELH